MFEDVFKKCAKEQEKSLKEAFDEVQTELRHALREAGQEALGCSCGGGEGGGDGGGPSGRVDLIVSAARHYLGLGITEPPGRNFEMIDRFIRRQKRVVRDGIEYEGSVVGAQWTTADVDTWVPDTPYYKNRMYSWCGAFVAACYGAAGLQAKHRYSPLPSCSRLAGEWGGTSVERKRSEIAVGDIVTVGKASQGADHKGTHIVLVVDVFDDHIVTIEGNATYGGREGVITRTRPFAGSGSTYTVKKVYRPTADMFDAPPAVSAWKW